MHPANREITDSDLIHEVVEKCQCCRLGFADQGEVYIVPLNFGYEQKGGQYVFYFHGAMSGRKYGLLQKSPEVGFEMDTDYRLEPGREAAACTAHFRSIVGTGRASLIENPEEKMRAIQLLMKHYRGRDGWEIPDRLLARTAIFQVAVTRMSCRVH